MTAERTSVIRVRTPEGVSFSFRLASPALRLVALAIDFGVISAAWSIITVLVNLLGILSRDLAQALAVIGYFVLSQGYRIAAEWLWRGQTVGKRLMRLRVVDERGFRLAFAQIALRNLMRFVDGLPLAYLLGGIACLLSRRGQRLGDLVGGTLVVWEPFEYAPDLENIRGEKYNSLRAYPSVVARLRQAATPSEARVAWQAMARRKRLSETARVEIFALLSAHFQAMTPFPSDAVDGISDEQLVRNVVDVLYRDRK